MKTFAGGCSQGVAGLEHEAVWKNRH